MSLRIDSPSIFGTPHADQLIDQLFATSETRQRLKTACETFKTNRQECANIQKQFAEAVKQFQPIDGEIFEAGKKILKSRKFEKLLETQTFQELSETHKFQEFVKTELFQELSKSRVSPGANAQELQKKASQFKQLLATKEFDELSSTLKFQELLETKEFRDLSKKLKFEDFFQELSKRLPFEELRRKKTLFLANAQSNIKIYNFNSHSFVPFSKVSALESELNRYSNNYALYAVHYSKTDRDHFIQQIDMFAQKVFPNESEKSKQADVKVGILIKTLRITNPKKVPEFIEDGIQKQAQAFKEMDSIIKKINDEITRREKDDVSVDKTAPGNSLRKRRGLSLKKIGWRPTSTHSPASSPDRSSTHGLQFDFEIPEKVTEQEMVLGKDEEPPVIKENPLFLLPKHLAPGIREIAKRFELMANGEKNTNLKDKGINRPLPDMHRNLVDPSRNRETPISQLEKPILRQTSNVATSNKSKSQDSFLVRLFNSLKHYLNFCKNWISKGVKMVKNFFLSSR